MTCDRSDLCDVKESKCAGSGDGGDEIGKAQLVIDADAVLHGRFGWEAELCGKFELNTQRAEQ